MSRYEVPTQGISVSELNSFAILVVQTLTMVWSSEDKNTPSIRPTNTTISCLNGRVTTSWLVTWGGPGSRLPWLEDLEDLVEAEDRLVLSNSSFWSDEWTCSIYSVLSGREVNEVLAMAADDDEFISLKCDFSESITTVPDSEWTESACVLDSIFSRVEVVEIKKLINLERCGSGRSMCCVFLFLKVNCMVMMDGMNECWS